jgi:spore coat polysaccharide biosynthesis protein SpsF
MKTVAIIQARMGATRLPGKVLRPLGDRSVLSHVIGRVTMASRLDSVMVATTDQAGDDAVAAECARLKVACFRGSEHDVLARYYGAAWEAHAQIVVRVTADCPLYDGTLLDRMLAEFGRLNATGVAVDYMSNVIKRTFPRGLDTEIFTFAALERTHQEATQPHEREHVTPFLYQHPELFCLHSFTNNVDLSDRRWTLDTPEDWRFIEAVYKALYREGTIFTTADVLKLLKERPDLAKLNAHVEQKKPL